MPIEIERADLLVDTSVAIPLVVADHTHHEQVFAAVSDLWLGLAGHAAFETYSVLTRLPSPTRLTPAAAARVIASNFPATVFPSVATTESAFVSLHTLGIAGGAVFDALVGLAAIDAEIALATRDERAVPTYRALKVEIRVI